MNLRSALLGVAATAAMLLASAGGHAQPAGFQFPGTPWNAYAPSSVQCGELLGANANITTDQPITISVPSAVYSIEQIQFSNPSISLTTAAGGVYSGAGKTGIIVVAAAQAYSSLTTSTANTTGNLLAATLSTAGNTTNFAAQSSTGVLSTLYWALTTAQGSAAKVDIRVYCHPMYN